MNPPKKPCGNIIEPYKPEPLVLRLAQSWLVRSVEFSTASNPGRVLAARKSDLALWGQAINAIKTGDTTVLEHRYSYDLNHDLGHVSLEELASPDLLREALRIIGMSRKPATLRRCLTTLRGFCKTLHFEGHLKIDPTVPELLNTPRFVTDRTYVTHAFSFEEVEAAVLHAAQPTSVSRVGWPARDVAIVRVLADCGLRAREVCMLRATNLDYSQHHPLVRILYGSKGSKPRLVPLPKRTQTAIETYLEERQGRFGDQLGKTSPLFVRNDGSPMNGPFLDRLLRRVLNDAGVSAKDGACAHAFRHYYGVELATRGVKVPVLSALMGHNDPRTTAIYMKMVGSQLVEGLYDAAWL